jgi:rhamnogalacturonan endolyase
LNYQGTANGTLVITITALARHAPNLNGDVDGSIQLLLPEDFTLGGNNFISGDLLVPGTPAVNVNGAAFIAGIKDAAGEVEPTDYAVTLNGNAVLRYVVRRVNPIAFATVAALQTPTGTRSVELHNENQNAGNFSTIADLTIGGNVGEVVVPPGAYHELTANGGGVFVLGNAGATTPAVYHVQKLTLNGNATLRIAGPVILELGSSVNFMRDVGAEAHPEWLTLQLPLGDLTLQAGAVFHGDVIAPNGNVTIGGGAKLQGHVSADSLTINGGGLLVDPAP